MSTLTPVNQIFWLQITDKNGHVIELVPGGRLEVEFVAACAEAICRQGVGLFKTTKHVQSAVTTGITEVLYRLKQRTISIA